MLLFLLSLLNPLQAEEKYTELKQGEPAPYAGILLTKEAVAKIYADQESEIAKLKLDHSVELEKEILSNKVKYELLDSRYKLNEKMYKEMISNRDNAIESLHVYSQSYKADWSMIGGFVLGSVITVGIVYSLNNLDGQ